MGAVQLLQVGATKRDIFPEHDGFKDQRDLQRTGHTASRDHMSTGENVSLSWDTAAMNLTDWENAPRKNKIVLMVLEILPLCGPLGIDRFYLGSTFTGLAKLTVCVC